MTYNPISLVLSQQTSGSRHPHIATVGVPFIQGLVQEAEVFSVVTRNGDRLPTEVRTTALWPDGTVKWAQVRFIDGQFPQESTGYLLGQNSDRLSDTGSTAGFSVKETDDSIVISDDETNYHFVTAGDQIFPSVVVAGNQVWSADDFHIGLLGKDGQALLVKKTATKVHRQDSLAVLVDVRAIIECEQQTPVNALFRFEVIRGKVLSVMVEIHNPRRTVHKDGIWDLGDPNSFNFRELSVVFNRRDTDRITLRPEVGQESIDLNSADPAILFQASSGGKNWDSPTHLNAQGVSCNQFCGYTLDVNNKTVISGKRANPVACVQREGQGSFVVKVRDFWQNFPKSMSSTTAQFSIGVFPVEHLDGYELQGGERKQHDIVFSFTDDADNLEWLDNSATVKVAPDAIAQAAVLGNPGREFEAYDRLIRVSLSESQGLMAKREDQDEFGWRHYGDVVADHETLYHESDDIFVSHYNNQYDAIYGFARQYLLTSDPRWYRLMDDLARHVLDIDIYRTVEDRAEYNHGLFWHTDHYLQAFTCSHRTYSKSHYANDWNGNKGGGPGPEHCYTTGLKLYYQVTGNEDARDAVLGLTQWIRYYYEGTGTLAERCKNLVSRDKRDIVSVLKGQQVFRYRYGFDRGVGNYMRALLDSYELTLDESYVRETEAIIMNTFGCGDDISLRHLDDVEFTWFYTVFLQEIVRYLDLKRTMGSLDSAFCYARDALLHYSHWMVVNETPALNSSKPLEYANDTWIAQDIRKANILYAAYRYADENREPLLLRSKEFRDYVTSALEKSDTLHFARIQIILLQNHGPSALMDTPAEPYDGMAGLHKNASSDRSCFYTRASFVGYLFASFWQVVKKFSITREVSWVKARLG